MNKIFNITIPIALTILAGCNQLSGKTEAVEKKAVPVSREAATDAVDDCCAVEVGEAQIQDENAKGNPNAIAIPPEVQKNLSMTFAKVERRIVEGVYRVPGVFELRPEARREYHVMLEGRVSLHVKQFAPIAKGDLLATLDSPAWRALQHSAVEAEGEIRVAEAHVEVARARLQEVEQSISFIAQRISNLQSANVRQIALESELATLKSQKPRLAAELNAAEVGLQEAHEHYLSRLRTMSSVTGLTREELLVEAEEGGLTTPHWHNIDKLEIRAEAAGVVDSLDATNGAWIETGTHVLATVDPGAIRFAAQAPQSEMSRFRNGQSARIAPPEGGSIAPDDVMHAKVQVGFIGHAEERVLPLYAEPETLANWAKPGISGYLEIVTTQDATAELAIPEAALVRDELDLVYFRRDPNHKNDVLKIKADLGVSDGRWIVVKSGVTDGDEVVVEGAYALKLAGSKSQSPAGYHYHADGSLHKDH